MNEEINRAYIEELAHKYRFGTITEEEKAYFNQWYDSFRDERLEFITSQATDPLVVRDRMHTSLMKRVNSNKEATGNRNNWTLWKRLASAAIIILSIGALLYVYNGKQYSAEGPFVRIKPADILAGSHKARLTLANGVVVDLTSLPDGPLPDQHSGNIEKREGGEIIYSGASITDESGTNTITIPKGGEYRLTLADGTKVWLNAASRLTYPVSFGQVKERIVELEGEAYFEVAKDKAHPFVVKTAMQETKVLGTHFNVNSYPDEGTTVITLAEGSVNVTSVSGKGITIKPGQSASTTGDDVAAASADLQTSLAWKNGLIEFKDADIKAIMRLVSRWYNIEVKYKGAPGNRHFDGAIPRQSNLSALLRILEFSNVRFELSRGKDSMTTLTVLP